MRRTLLLTPLILVALCLTAGAGEELSDANFDKLKKQILPDPSQLKWQEIPWLSTYWDSVLVAQAKDKPILLWAMNGHPLACV